GQIGGEVDRTGLGAAHVGEDGGLIGHAPPVAGVVGRGGRVQADAKVVAGQTVVERRHRARVGAAVADRARAGVAGDDVAFQVRVRRAAVVRGHQDAGRGRAVAERLAGVAADGVADDVGRAAGADLDRIVEVVAVALAGEGVAFDVGNGLR